MKSSTFILGLIPDCVIAYLIMVLLWDEKSLGVFIFIFIALQVLYLIRWIFQSIVGWVTFSMNKEKLIEGVYKELKEKKFPEPDKYTFDKSMPHHFYRLVANDLSVDVSTRISAQAMESEVNILRSVGQLQAMMRLTNIHSASLKQYQSDFEK